MTLSIRKCQKTGIWAWDCATNEPVLLIPTVLALLGDNPMQSEFACHIGLRGKLFCRACWVKGSDTQADTTQQRSDSPGASSHGSEASEADTASDSEPPEWNSDGTSSASVAPSKRKKGRRKRVLESMSSMVDRVKAFTKVKFYCI